MPKDPDIDRKLDANEDEFELVPVRYNITSYGADFPVDSLVRRLAQGDIVIPMFDPNVSAGNGAPGFQRDFVWTKRQSDRFIESLLFGFPVPGIFLFRDDENRHLVLDGQQRLRTLASFYSGALRERGFALTDVHDEWNGLKYADLQTSDRRRLDDTIIHATIVRQETPADDLSSVYLIFERLNTGGTALSPQQIRVALYHGELVDLVRELNGETDWRALVGKRSATLKDHELILRCFALLYNRASYARPMKGFLNSFLESHRGLGGTLTKEDLSNVFRSTVKVVRAALGDRAFRLKSAVNAALTDAVFVGIAERIRSRGMPTAPSQRKIAAAFKRLLKNDVFVSATSRATADEEAVKRRLSMAIKAFATA